MSVIKILVEFNKKGDLLKNGQDAHLSVSYCYNDQDSSECYIEEIWAYVPAADIWADVTKQLRSTLWINQKAHEFAADQVQNQDFF